MLLAAAALARLGKFQRLLLAAAALDVERLSAPAPQLSWLLADNEMEPKESDDAFLNASSAAVYAAMSGADPDAIWLMQGWLFHETFWNPKTMKASDYSAQFLSRVAMAWLLIDIVWWCRYLGGVAPEKMCTSTTQT